VIEARVVDDGDIVTAGGPSCGIDLALHILEREFGPEFAAAAAQEVHYTRPAGAVQVQNAASSLASPTGSS
jgi:transcriptional regulator GlxA family with amidase domain